MGNSIPSNHEDHIAGKGENSLQHYNLVHKFIPVLQARNIPAAKAAVDKEWEKLEMADILRFSLWGLVVVVAMSVLCGIEMNEHETNGDRHDGSHPPTCLFFCNVASNRRLVAEQVPVTNIAIFVLYGLVMNPTPPWSLRDALAQDVGCHDYCRIWIVWSRDTCLPPWHLKDVDAEVSVVMKAVVLCSLNITAQCWFVLYLHCVFS